MAIICARNLSRSIHNGMIVRQSVIYPSWEMHAYLKGERTS